ncbi:MAG TPA: TonB-dependent receptor [Opitutaceae bacterium]|nr:TonB-dependent receptor [Opitutaceae bacterium]
MKARSLLYRAALFACAALAPALLRAQNAPAATGTIIGRVENADSATYLGNARVRLLGTDRETQTADDGTYHFDRVPAGEATLDVFYTSLPEQQASVIVAPGQVVTRDFALRRAAGAAAAPVAATGANGVVNLNPFVVQSERETNAAALAMNEQRFSPGIENVVSTDAYGEINQGNIGEFVKHIPGVNIEFKDGNNPSGIDIRGFGTNYTHVTVDGNSVASAAIANTQTPNRQFVLEGASINNYSRIEVSKEPLPNNPANSMGGAVNLVSKSAFEYAKPVFNVETYLSGNSYAFDSGKIGGVYRDPRREIVPSIDATLVEPINSRLGLVATVSDSDQFYTTIKNSPARTFTSNGATVTNPYTGSFTAQMTPNEVRSLNGSVKLDFKVTANSVLSLTGMATAYKQESGSHTIAYNVGPTPLAWNSTFTHGGVGKASAPSMGGGWQNRNALTRFIGANYRLDTGDWIVTAGATYSNANNLVRDTAKGFFNSVSTSAAAVKTINFDGFDDGTASVGRVSTLDAGGNPVDTTKLSNFNMTQVGSMPATNQDTITEEHLDVTRAFDTPWFPLSITAGGDTQNLVRDLKYWAYNYTYFGPDGVAASGDEGLNASLADPTFTDSPRFGLPGYQWLSPWAVYDLYRAHPGWFGQTVTQQGDSIKNFVTRSPLLMERVTSWYLMGDVKFFHNRLRIVGGWRYELTADKGYGGRTDSTAIYQKDASGNIVVKNGAFQLLPQLAGTVSGSAAQNAYIYTYRANFNSRDYHGYFPSGAVTFDLTKDLQLRGAFAETIGRPSPSDIVPTLSITPNSGLTTDPSAYPGTISSSNTTLVPWTAKNYDLELAYYTPHNGLLSFGVFRKDIKNFFSSLTETVTPALATQIGLGPDYVGWRYSTRVNGGDARIDGVEAGFNQELDFVPVVGRYVSLYGNITKLSVTGFNASTFDLKNGGGNIPLTGNAGARVTIRRFSVYANWNYRGEQFRDTASQYPGAEEDVLPVTQWDGGVEYQLSKHLLVFAAGRNLNNGVTRWSIDGPSAPDWAKMETYYTNGAQYSFGVRASF